MNPRVLVAEDDPDVLTIVADALALQGYGVVRAESGAALVDQLASEGPFDLIVTDVSMPWMDGLKATLHAYSWSGNASDCDDGAQCPTDLDAGTPFSR